MKEKQKQQERNTISCKQMPQDSELEKAVLGGLLLENSAINEIAHFLKPEAFYADFNRDVYSTIMQMYSEGDKIDMLTVCERFRKAGYKYDNLIYLISKLTDNIGSVSHIERHALILHQLMIARKMIVICNIAESKSFDISIDISDTVEETLKEIENVTSCLSFGKETVSIGDAAKESVKRYEKRKILSSKGERTGIDTGITKLNINTNGGWKPGQLIILAARPAMGKSALMVHFAKMAALSGTHAMIFSLEMEAQSLANRIIMSRAEINQYDFSTGRLSYYEEQSYYRVVDGLKVVPITIDDTPNISIQQIKIRALNEQRKGRCGIIFIDYLQLIDMRHANKTYNREQEVSQTSRAAKIMAKELGVPVVLLSQLSRNVEGRADKLPLLSDLRESGAIEQDADIVLFIHRPEYYSDDAIKGEGSIILAKQRDGATGSIKFMYNHSLTRISGEYDDPSKPLPF